jgi:hypothetical protein
MPAEQGSRLFGGLERTVPHDADPGAQRRHVAVGIE